MVIVRQHTAQFNVPNVGYEVPDHRVFVEPLLKRYTGGRNEGG